MQRLRLRPDRSPHQYRVPAQRGARTSIARRLRWSYLISSTLPLLIVGALLLNINLEAQQNNVYNNQKGTATRIARDIARYVTDIQDQLQSYGLRVRPGASIDRLAEDAINLEARSYPNPPNVIDLAILNSDGQEWLRVRKLQRVDPSELRDLGADPAIRAALDEGRSSYTAIGLNEDGTRSFIATLPLRNDAGTIIHALRAEISAEPIARDLRITASNASSGGYAYLIRADDGVVLIDDGSGEFVAPREISRLIALQEGTAQYMGARDQVVIGAVVPVTVGESGIPTGWSVVVEQPAAVAFASVRSSVLILALLVILVGVLALLWAFRQARRFLQPLEALRTGAAMLGEGHLEHRIESLDNDELGDVAQTFNHMADHLQQSLAEIEQQNERLRRGLALARDIQLGLLPDGPPWSGEEIAVYGRSLPAYEVGGDFYTYLALSEGRGAVAIGDISGKGVGAALLMALTSSTVESQGRQLEHPAQVLTALNQLLFHRLKTNHMNAALLFAVIDPSNRVIRIANAGMISPMLVTSAGSRFVDAVGLPLGSFAGAVYQEVSIPFDPSDALLLLSDGVVEAHNAQGVLFGFERLEAIVGEAAALGDVTSLVELVIERVQAHMGDAEQHDDITIVAVRPMVVAENVLLDEERTVDYATL